MSNEREHENQGQGVDGQGGRKIDMEAGRRAFLKYTGLAAAGASMLAVPGMVGQATAQQANLDVTILNFALNLEYLEAEFYLRAVTGNGLSDADITGSGTAGPVLGGSKVPFTDSLVADYAAEIADDEQKHVKFLRAALAGQQVARPKINIKGAFTKAAVAAGLIQSGETFDAYASDVNFLIAAYIFEDVGVTAYHGAAALITNKDILTAAAGILAVEAYHAGLVRTILFGMKQFQATAKISALRSALSSAGLQAEGKDALATPDDQGVSASEGAAAGGPRTGNIVPTDVNSLAFSRDISQVLSIVYAGGNAGTPGGTGGGGLFFPNGVNFPPQA